MSEDAHEAANTLEVIAPPPPIYGGAPAVGLPAKALFSAGFLPRPSARSLGWPLIGGGLLLGLLSYHVKRDAQTKRGLPHTNLERSPTVLNAIPTFLVHLRHTIGKGPHRCLGWTWGNLLVCLFRYVSFGERDNAPITHERVREAEPDPDCRPVIHLISR
jgi:hypothetical protein